MRLPSPLTGRIAWCHNLALVVLAVCAPLWGTLNFNAMHEHSTATELLWHEEMTGEGHGSK